MPISEAQKKASLKYRKDKLGRIEFTVQKEYKENLEQHAAKQGEKLNDFIKRAIDETIKKDTSKI